MTFFFMSNSQKQQNNLFPVKIHIQSQPTLFPEIKILSKFSTAFPNFGKKLDSPTLTTYIKQLRKSMNDMTDNIIVFTSTINVFNSCNN